MTENRKQLQGPQGGRNRVEVESNMGLDHGADSLVAQDSPDDSTLGAPRAGEPKNTAHGDSVNRAD